MRLLSTVKRWIVRNLPLRGDLSAWEDVGLIRRTDSGVRVTPRKAIGSAAMWRGMNVLANAPFKLPLDLYVKTGEDSRRRAVEHPSYGLMRRKPHRLLTAANFKRTMTFLAILYGNSYAAILRNGRDEPGQLSILDPISTFPFYAEGELWYRTTVNGEQRKLVASDVLHIRGLSEDGIVGLSIVEVLANAIGHGISAREFAARFFKSGTTAAGILGVPQSMDPEAQKQAMADFAKLTAGMDNVGKVAVIGDGAKFFPLTFNAEQSQLLESIQYHDEKVTANILGLPGYILGSGERTSYNSLEMESQSLLDHSFDPLLIQWETECDDKLLTEEERETHYFEFNRNAMLRLDTATRMQAYKLERDMGMASANDLLKRENRETIGPQGDVYIIPANMQPLERMLAPEPEPAPAPAPEPEGNTDEQ